MRSYAFLTLKPRVYALNIGEDAIGRPAAIEGLDAPVVSICGKLEAELMDLEEAERAEFMADAGLAQLAAGRLVQQAYRALDLRSFFTHASDDLRAWSVPAGATAVEAAAAIHSDMAHGFIRAEVVAFDDLEECGSLKEAKARGKLRLEGRDYEVQDGDVVTIRHSG